MLDFLRFSPIDKGLSVCFNCIIMQRNTLIISILRSVKDGGAGVGDFIIN